MLPRAKSVLFADDSPDDLFLLREACRECGFTHPCVMVEDGEDVIAYLKGAGDYGDRKKNPEPGLVVLDIKMPRKTGLEALAWIREAAAWRYTPVIMLSASLHPGDILKSYELGADAYVVKPSSVQELQELMASLKTFWLRFNEYPPAP